AKVLGVSECSDLALIDIDGEGFSYMDWYADPVAVGLDVYVAGFPLGEPEYTLTKGIISKERASGETDWASIDSVIMHDATVNPGNSGGPLLTTDGKVVGINYRSRSAQDQYFAIGKEIALPIVEKLKGGQDVDTIGVNGVAVRSEDGSISGIWVSSVSSGSPADKTGLDGGDIVLNLEGQPLATDGTMADYCDIIRTHNPEDTLSMEVLRFATYEVLEGQLNGDALTQSYSFGDTAGTDTGGSEATGDASTDGYVVVYDDTGAIGVEVPASWNQVNGAIWEADWNNWHFKAANVIASTDIDGFFDYWNVAGVNFAASKDWGNIGGYVQLLDAAGDTWYVDSCDKEGRYDYDDGYYEGAYDLWECGSEAVVAVISARPINDPLAFLTMVQVQMVTDADVEAFEYILDTFDVVGRLP
ncbi:MAG: S1C family serine protease, partial [Chloroflexota bacterium]|nr:S1C family serine protease [Chloroflexota bacterium]